jgi:hypothetical protein
MNSRQRTSLRPLAKAQAGPTPEKQRAELLASDRQGPRPAGSPTLSILTSSYVRAAG